MESKYHAALIVADVKALARARPDLHELTISDKVAAIVSPAELAAATGLKVIVSP